MSEKIISYDFGTSGCKASLFDKEGRCIQSSSSSYRTFYPREGFHEQKPDQWWDAVIKSTRKLLEKSSVDAGELAGLAISGHSLGVVPVDRKGELLLSSVPIWSDRRAVEQAEDFFKSRSQKDWYLMTGNGFAKECYPLFKLQWFREHYPEIWKRCDSVLGTKDYINYLLTGVKATDHSYASGSGVYDLKARAYSTALLEQGELPSDIFPVPLESSDIIGTVTSNAAEMTGLPEGLPVMAGGVDNSCMALGAGNIEDRHVYLSLGSSAWIAVSSSEPVLDYKSRPFVFEHVVPGLYTSATSIFSACSSLSWFVDTLCSDCTAPAAEKELHVNDYLMGLALGDSVPGSHGVLFNPTLAGGADGDPRAHMSGSFSGIRLGIKREDIIRSVFEGISYDLALRYRELKALTPLDENLFVVGGGSKSPEWMQMFADIFDSPIVKSSIDQEAGALGAAALAAVGSGLWNDFSQLRVLNRIREEYKPDSAAVKSYRGGLDSFIRAFYQV